MRLNSNGSLDETFGESGIALIDFKNSHSWANDMIQQPDGKFILAGGASLEPTGSKFALSRITNDGKLYSSFGVNGLQTTAFSDNSSANCVALQSKGKIVLGGFYQKDDKSPSFLIARYNNDKTSKKQIIITKIKHYVATHNNAQATSLSNVSIYPNPTQSVLHISGLSSNKATLTLVDFVGNLKLQAVATGTSYNLNIAALSSGSYLLKIEMNDEVVMKQFIKQ